MTKLEKFVLTLIIRKEVRQGFDHNKRIANLYIMIRQAYEAEFTEDNAPTTDANLRELFESTQFSGAWP